MLSWGTALDRVAAAKERELRLVEDERDLASRKAALVATVSHEFRSPLTVITGMARTIETQGLVTGEGVTFLEMIRQSAHKLTSLVTAVNAVLDDPGSDAFVERRELDLRGLLNEAVAQAGVRDGESRTNIVLAPNAERMVSDPLLLGQLVGHLIENALKFSATGSCVEVMGNRRDDSVRIEILDRGPGIEDDFLDQLDPFSQIDRSSTRAHGGLGLGLFAASRLADAVGASLRFDHRAGGGTRAMVIVPSG